VKKSKKNSVKKIGVKNFGVKKFGVQKIDPLENAHSTHAELSAT